jgi:hypothetical protein
MRKDDGTIGLHADVVVQGEEGISSISLILAVLMGIMKIRTMKRVARPFTVLEDFVPMVLNFRRGAVKVDGSK